MNPKARAALDALYGLAGTAEDIGNILLELPAEESRKVERYLWPGVTEGLAIRNLLRVRNNPQISPSEVRQILISLAHCTVGIHAYAPAYSAFTSNQFEPPVRDAAHFAVGMALMPARRIPPHLLRPPLSGIIGGRSGREIAMQALVADDERIQVKAGVEEITPTDAIVAFEHDRLGWYSLTVPRSSFSADPFVGARVEMEIFVNEENEIVGFGILPNAELEAPPSVDSDVPQSSLPPKPDDYDDPAQMNEYLRRLRKHFHHE